MILFNHSWSGVYARWSGVMDLVQGYETFFMLNSNKHEIYPACNNANYLSRYHHHEWLHHEIKERFSRKNASVQNINNTNPWPLVGMLGSIRFLSRANNRSEPPQAKNKHKNVNKSTPAILLAFPFVKSFVTMWANDSNINKTVRNVCKAVNKLLLMYFFWMFVAYFLNTVHWIQPQISIKSNSSPDVTVLRKHWLIPSPYQILVKSESLAQYSILFLLFVHFWCSPEKQIIEAWWITWFIIWRHIWEWYYAMH